MAPTPKGGWNHLMNQVTNYLLKGLLKGGSYNHLMTNPFQS